MVVLLDFVNDGVLVRFPPSNLEILLYQMALKTILVLLDRDLDGLNTWAVVFV